MSAVIRTGGKQYRVEVGQHLVIERLSGEAGDQILFEEVLSTGVGDAIEIGTPTLAGKAVHGTIVEQKRSRKLLVFRRKRRKTFRRLTGHRQYQTVVEITAIGDSASMAAKKPTQKADTADTADDTRAAKTAAAKTSQTTAKTSSQATEQRADKLTTISGIGPVIEKKLIDLGITRFQQIAEMDDTLKASIEEQLNFKGRIDREQWIKQAKELVAG